jgi:hypothetical protein
MCGERRASQMTAGSDLAYSWHSRGMARTGVSTTVDHDLLTNARQAHAGLTDAALLDVGLAALAAKDRAVEIDASYAAYDEHPLEEPDAWGTSPHSERPPQHRDSEVVLEPGDDPVPRRSAVNLDSLESVSVTVLAGEPGA